MTDSVKISSVTSQLRVGTPKDNYISFQITAAKAPVLFAAIEIPYGPATAETKYLCGDMNAALDFASDPAGRITGGPPRDPEPGILSWISDRFLLTDEGITLTISGLNPACDGEASLHLKIWDNPESESLLYDRPIFVTIQPAEKTAVLSFRANLPVVLQGSEVIISSRIVKARTVELFANGIHQKVDDAVESRSGDYLDKEWKRLPEANPTKYQLKVDGEFAGPELIVAVENRGTMQSRHLLASSLTTRQTHYPTLLLKSKDLSSSTTGTPDAGGDKEEFPKLYGVFNFVKGDAKHAELWSSHAGVDDWTIESRRDFPKGMGESPGAIHSGALWLIGGSSVDPRGPYSNRVCAYYRHGGRMIWKDWSENKADSFPPRVGHACTVFKERIWVLGGISRAGAPLDDIWSCKVPENPHEFEPHWEKCPAPLPSPRCMCSVAVTPSHGREPERLWLYGGTTHPDNVHETFDDLWWTNKIESGWENLILPGEEGGKTLSEAERATTGATLLYANDGRLHLLRKFRSGTNITDVPLEDRTAEKPWAAASELGVQWKTAANNLLLIGSISFRGRWILWPVDQYMDRLTYNKSETSSGLKTNYETMIYNAAKFE